MVNATTSTMNSSSSRENTEGRPGKKAKIKISDTNSSSSSSSSNGSMSSGKRKSNGDCAQHPQLDELPGSLQNGTPAGSGCSTPIKTNGTTSPSSSSTSIPMKQYKRDLYRKREIQQRRTSNRILRESAVSKVLSRKANLMMMGWSRSPFWRTAGLAARCRSALPFLISPVNAAYSTAFLPSFKHLGKVPASIVPAPRHRYPGTLDDARSFAIDRMDVICAIRQGNRRHVHCRVLGRRIHLHS